MRAHSRSHPRRRDLEPIALPRFLLRTAHQDRDHQASRPSVSPRARSRPWLAMVLVLPFAAGYVMTCAFRSINAIVAGSMAGELDLSAAELGFMTSAFFLAMAAAQLPVGNALDRYGPRRVHAVLMGVAAVGAAVFACGQTVEILVLGRLLIGFGVAGALMAGLKAIVLWVPPERTALANGWVVMIGTLGSVIATWPADTLVVSYGWRPLFAVNEFRVSPRGRSHAVGPARWSAPACGRRSIKPVAGRHLSLSALLADRAALGDHGCNVLVITGLLGRALASGRRRVAAHSCGGDAVHHGADAECSSACIRHWCRSLTTLRRRAAHGAGSDSHRLDHGAVGGRRTEHLFQSSCHGPSSLPPVRRRY